MPKATQRSSSRECAIPQPCALSTRPHCLSRDLLIIPAADGCHIAATGLDVLACPLQTLGCCPRAKEGRCLSGGLRSHPAGRGGAQDTPWPVHGTRGPETSAGSGLDEETETGQGEESPTRPPPPALPGQDTQLGTPPSTGTPATDGSAPLGTWRAALWPSGAGGGGR